MMEKKVETTIGVQGLGFGVVSWQSPSPGMLDAATAVSAEQKPHFWPLATIGN